MAELPLDEDIDPKEEIRYRKDYKKLWNITVNYTHFRFEELEDMMVIYYKIANRERSLTKNHEMIVTRASFRDVLHNGLNMTDNVMMERIITAVKGGVNFISMETFAKTFSIFLRGTLQEKIDYCFLCYDIMRESTLKKEHIYHLMKNNFVKTFQNDDVESAIKELINIIFRRMDLDGDGNISYEDYKQSVLETPRLLESFGVCLPDHHRVNAFLATWSKRWPKA